MIRVTPQVQLAILQMKGAGFEHGRIRSNGQFFVEVERFSRSRNGERWIEYGNAVIVMLCASNVIEERIETICRTGLGVWEYRLEDGRKSFSVSTHYDDRGKHTIFYLFDPSSGEFVPPETVQHDFDASPYEASVRYR